MRERERVEREIGSSLHGPDGLPNTIPTEYNLCTIVFVNVLSLGVSDL